MTSDHLDPAGEVRTTLTSIVNDFGPAALSKRNILDGALQDYLPGESTAVKTLLLEAADAGIASSLQEHISQGMDPDSAVRLTAAKFEEHSPSGSEGCLWVTGEFARVLGYQVSDAQLPVSLPPPPEAPAVPPPAEAPAAPPPPTLQPPPAVITAPVPIAGGGSQSPTAAGPTASAGSPPPPPPPPPLVYQTRKGHMSPFVWLGIGLAVLLGGGAVAIALSSHSHSGSASTTQATVNSPHQTTQPIATTLPTQPLAQQQATQLSGLLTQSANDRSAINAAVSSIGNCGNLIGAQTALTASATSRQSLLNQLQRTNLTALPGSGQLTQFLTAAWNNSEASDQSYANWASDEISRGCSPNDTADLNYQNAQVSDGQSTSNKTSFAALWNPIAATYNLPTVTQASF